ncbi:variable surface protein [Plasmodium gonderi]|uniref:Variable surface protein n=1 Tax=Plasmodium gonderi TaxID=77519 RepID=A0A1Y1JWU8_PLAGO|nr:variable surface protein [Plasmodium gonderi]GAW84294.1 variable surface protein [Plasmodium gonderi]
MGNTQLSKAQLSFKDIFPEVKSYYHSLLYLMIQSPVNRALKQPCNDISAEFTPYAILNNVFSTSCIKLGLYLHELKNRKEDTRKPYCNFYIYELKREARNKSPNVNSFDDLHKKLTDASSKTDVLIPDVCKEYVSIMNDDVYEIFKMFDELYDNFKSLKDKKKNNKDQYVKLCVETYDKFSKIDKTKFNNTIDEELDKFKREFNSYLQKEPICKGDNASENCFLGNLGISAITVEALSGDTLSPVTWTSTGILFFAIIIIIFIVYKYTAYGSYIRPRRRKLKNIWKRKNKKYYGLMNLFEQSQKNIIQNKHNILYNSVE